MRFGFLTLAFLSSHCWATPSFGERFNLADQKQHKPQKLIEDKENYSTRWETEAEICWQDKRASKCPRDVTQLKKQKLSFECNQSKSALCMDVNCEMSGTQITNVNEISIYKGDHRDFLLVHGSLSGCGGTSYSLAMIDENSKVKCSFYDAVAFSGMEADEAAETLLSKIYNKPWQYIKWKNDICEFHLSPKNKKILKEKQ